MIIKRRRPWPLLDDRTRIIIDTRRSPLPASLPTATAARSGKTVTSIRLVLYYSCTCCFSRVTVLVSGIKHTPI